jgi:hypothetical protein
MKASVSLVTSLLLSGTALADQNGVVYWGPYEWEINCAQPAMETMITSGAGAWGIPAGNVRLDFQPTEDDSPQPWTTFRDNLPACRTVFLDSHGVSCGGTHIGEVFEDYRTLAAVNAHAFAIVPMGFCYPGTGPGGDLPPRPECAETWRERVLAELTGVKLTVALGQYAHAWHLDGAASSVTEVVRDWRRWWPAALPLPHPSPRNRRWLARNPWVEAEMIPKLRARVRRLLR